MEGRKHNCAISPSIQEASQVPKGVSKVDILSSCFGYNGSQLHVAQNDKEGWQHWDKPHQKGQSHRTTIQQDSSRGNENGRPNDGPNHDGDGGPDTDPPLHLQPWATSVIS